jgi:hypothetical protein
MTLVARRSTGGGGGEGELSHASLPAGEGAGVRASFPHA